MQSFDQAKEQAKPVENLAAAENQLKSIEKDIKALGPVNVDAIEQYDEVKGRFDFLSSQREDVLAAKNMLLSTINDMNDEVRNALNQLLKPFVNPLKSLSVKCLVGVLLI